jgi:hypothetical protein
MKTSLAGSLLSWLFILLLSIILALLVFEVIYRYQLIDTFSGEMRSYNPVELLDPNTNQERNTLLVMGDSFTADPASYASMLRTCQNNFSVINAGISGTGVIEAVFTAPGRFELAKPSIFIYQVFVGNDLYNISYPINWQALSPLRNVYWTLAQRLRSVWYINYRNGQFAQFLGQSDSHTVDLTAFWQAGQFESAHSFSQEQTPSLFSPEKFTLRDKLMLQADPWILDKQIRVKGDRQADFHFFLNKLDELLAHCIEDECVGYVLVIPHQVQLTPGYYQNMQALGGQFAGMQEILSADYPFLSGVREFLAQDRLKHIQLLDPLPTLRHSEAQGKPVYYQNDSHLNHQGNRIVTRFLLDKLGLDLVCSFLD